ncbi:bacillithiol system redox-active protein YtxJ [Bacillus horti]|uniref:Bacillithiol system protein YtxJ n=1 Tax=Caldalkalibacillus horti TaxID=77523 RepID=A0ABT9W1B7_9BACI|nr:bacillithiol system redox-active protein YtxJ [Bacillus horti]MDQ0167053.1 bacillithiol system protein YtxJ [Bacillus horti]
MKYQEITTVEEWANLLEQSIENKLFVFKHSTTCPISAAAYDEFKSYLAEASSDVTHVLVKVIESRPVSNQIAADLGVEHQSPQAILIENKEAKWNDSHWRIKKSKLLEVTTL